MLRAFCFSDLVRVFQNSTNCAEISIERNDIGFTSYVWLSNLIWCEKQFNILDIHNYLRVVVIIKQIAVYSLKGIVIYVCEMTHILTLCNYLIRKFGCL